MKRVKGVLKALVVCTLAVSVFVAWSGFTNRDLPWPLTLLPGQGHEVTGNDPDFADLELTGDAGTPFGGSISVENTTGTYQDVWVSVDVFDGEQNVGELWGSVTLKPHSSSTVGLLSVDRYVSWSDARVELSRTSS